MPTYEYQCAKCKKRREAFQSITAKSLVKCPKCGGRLKRLISRGSGFLFKGSGFYITDYRSKSYRDAKKKDQDGKQKDQDAKKKDQPASSSSDGKSSSSSSKT